MRSIVLLSGGLDSAVALARTPKDADRHTLTVAYGQTHEAELESARIISARYGAEHSVVRCELGGIAPSPLTGCGEFATRTLEELREGPSPAFVPGRNSILVALGIAWADALGGGEVVLAANADDAAGFVDCRPEFCEAANAMAGTASLREVNVSMPLISWSKSQIAYEAVRLAVPIADTLSCYTPINGMHCGRCDACTLRRDAFEKAGYPDPTQYVADL